MNKKVFKIEIQEVLSEIIEIEAYDINEAITKAKKMYKDEEIILDEQNYVTTEFSVSE